MIAARELFSQGKGGNVRVSDEVNVSESPYDREEGHSWRYAECSLLMEPSVMERIGHSLVPGIFIGPLAVSVLLAWWLSCWLLSLPGLAWLCLPPCLWAGCEIHKLWLYWDGRVQFVEDWPPVKIARTSLAVLLFAGTLGVNLFAAGFSFWGFRAWLSQGSCPF